MRRRAWEDELAACIIVGFGLLSWVLIFAFAWEACE